MSATVPATEAPQPRLNGRVTGTDAQGSGENGLQGGAGRAALAVAGSDSLPVVSDAVTR